MKKILLTVILASLSTLTLAAGGNVPLLDFTPNLKDQAGLQRGAAAYMNYCAGCHSMKYMRYERLATDLGIPNELAEENLIFTGQKIGALMVNPTSPKLQKQWFGAAPPDLTLVARSRGDAWLYSYLKGFYLDDTRPYGYNNLVFKDVGMPNVLLNLQGDQVCKPALAVGENGYPARDPISHIAPDNPNVPCGRTELVDSSGKLSEKEFDVFVSDLVNFLVYTAEPVRIHDRTVLGFDINKRQMIGIYCLLFLMVFGVFAVLLNREYWKDIH